MSHESDEDNSDSSLRRAEPDSPTPVLRRSASGVVAGANANLRGQKHLRFTAMTSSDGSVEMESTEDVYYPGKRLITTHHAYMNTEPGTPNISETADQIRRTISLASLEQLMTLHQDQERRDQFISGVTRAGRDLVWRDKDEKKVYPTDAERAVVLAAKRGLRSFILAFSVRSGVNLVLLLFRVLRRKKLTVRDIRQAVVGIESFRFGAMIGTFTFLNTMALHLLRLAPPLSYLKRRIKAGLFSRATFGPPEREGYEGEQRWHAAAAGAIGSLGLLWETIGRRRGISQQMFVRGLQAAYNQYTPALGIHIPHGDILLFGLCCGQIMFAFLLSPETIPREYSNWIQNASGVQAFTVAANRTAVRNNFISPSPIDRALKSVPLTAKNKASLENILVKIEGGWKPDYHIPCSLLHPWVDSCIDCNFRRFFTRFRFMLPVYGALHLIPMLVFRRHQVAKEPLRMLLKAGWGITRSCSFLGIFVVIYQSLFCMRSQVMDSKLTPGWLQAILRRKENFWLIGFMTCFSLFAEEKRRRAELAMYCLPRALESAWSVARRRAWVPIVPFGETMLGAAAMAMIMDSYKHQPKAMSGIVRNLMYQLVGPV